MKLWKTKDRGFMPMSDMENDHLQSALLLVQRRQMDTIKQLEIDVQLEEELRAEIKHRKLIPSIFSAAGTSKAHIDFGNKYQYLVKTIGTSIKRKLKELNKDEKTEAILQEL